ncbi:hypothetical protein PZ938_06295 [Luteipulveratus sp. YIM 133132]|uniref:hypothetical protein n=1 Tax=Luteipulveratus flavus TaxID=3031728 RepID=UPI0023B1C682|nr:hypothetical protein [Luteipulveratus sp. YIM 133132]MDE9365211.1 hypothetical protein [Luteipulveratus sp. YIM 133132]
MTTAPERPAASRANLLSAAVLLLALAAYLLYAVRAGLPVTHALAAAAMIALTQVLPGTLVWRSIRPVDGWLVEDVVMGFAVGVALAVPVQIVAGLSHQRWLAIVLLLLVAVVLLLVPVTRRRITQARWTGLPWWFVPVTSLVSILFFPQLRSYFTANRLTWGDSLGQPHIDTYLHQALASQLLNRGPGSWPTVLGEDLGYHWFGHAWIAQVTASSGVGLDEVLMRVLPSLMPLTLVLTVAFLALRLSRTPWVAVLAVVITAVGSQGNMLARSTSSLPLTPESPTLGLGVPTLLALVLVLTMRWRGEARTGAFVLVPLFAVVASGTKGSTAPLVVAGLALALVAMMLWNRSLVRPVLIDLVVVTACLGAVVVLVFHGSSAGLALNPNEAAEQTAYADWLGSLDSDVVLRLIGVLAVLGGLTRAALTFVLPFSRTARLDPLTWLLVGASVAGAGAVAIFSHPGHSQGYFLLTVIPLAATGSALGAQKLLEVLGPRALAGVLVVGVLGGAAVFGLPTMVTGRLVPDDGRVLTLQVVIAVVVVILAAVAGYLVAADGTSRPASAAASVAVAGLFTGVLAFQGAVSGIAPTVTTRVLPTSQLATSQGEIDTARFIRDHSGVDDLVMTNRHCTTLRPPFGGCDSRRWLVTAFSERQLLVEGWTATPRATKIAPHGRDSVTVDYWKPEILRLNDGFIAAPTEAARDRLWALGVRWVYAEARMPHAQDPGPYATVRYRAKDGTASAWQLQPPSRG